jgi:hypothetical protein
MTAMREPQAKLPPRVVVRTAWVLHRALDRLSGGRLGLRPSVAGVRFGMLRLMTVGRSAPQRPRSELGRSSLRLEALLALS